MSNHRFMQAALLCSAGVAMMANAASAMPAAPGVALQKAATSSLETVRWRGRGWGGRGLGWGLGGFAAGAIIGGALASPYYYGGPYYGPYGYYPPPYPAPYPSPAYEQPDDEVSYCAQRYRSYDPRTGTYLGFDGARHPCP
jgi:hypothetical protein